MDVSTSWRQQWGRMCSFEGHFSAPLEHACTRLSHLRLYVARPDGEPTEPSPPEPTVTHGPGRGGTDPSDSPPQTPAAPQQVDWPGKRCPHSIQEPVSGGGRDGGDAATSPGALRAPSCWRDRKDPFPEPPEGAQPCSPDPGIPAPELGDEFLWF